MPIINLIMFAISIGSVVLLHFTGSTDPALTAVLTTLASASLGVHAGATTPVLGSNSTVAPTVPVQSTEVIKP